MLKNRLYIPIFAGALLLVFAAVLLHWSALNRGLPSEDFASFAVPQDLAEGDLVLRRGKSYFSELIARAFPQGQEMSHVGIVIREDDGWQVVHSISGKLSESDGIRAECLESFCKAAQQEKVCFVRAAFEVDREAVGELARYYLRQNVPFDHTFDLQNDDAMYCSELIRAVYLRAGAEDHFHYQNVSGKAIIDMASFFDANHWRVLD